MVDILIKHLIYTTCIDICYDGIFTAFANVNPNAFERSQYYDELVIDSNDGPITYRDVNIFQCVGDMLVFSHTDYVTVDESGVITYQKCLKVANVGSVISRK